MSELKYLRALSFKSILLETLPDSIGELIHLRYLNLSESNIVTLPESLGRLYNLQTLKLYRCSKLKMLPDSMQDLVNLRHLDIRSTKLNEMPRGMSKLKSLQFLSDFVVGKHEGNKIRELGALANLQQSICITHLENVVNSSEASEARMSDRDGIDLLKLHWSEDEDDDENTVDFQNEKDILDKLRPHSNLKHLEIKGYRGTAFPDWLGYFSCDNITDITLSGCRNCRVLPSLGQLPFLKDLSISDSEILEIVGVEFYRDDESCLETPFPMLETLRFEYLTCWREWHSVELNAFPQLRKLTIMDCPMLRGDLPNYLPSLQSLEIQKCLHLSCSLPRAPALTELNMADFYEEVVEGKVLVEFAMEVIKQRQLIYLTCLSITCCDSHILFPVSAIPTSLQKLRIVSCRKLEFQMDGQQYLLQELSIIESCDLVTSFSLDAFPNIKDVYIRNCEKMECIVVSGSLSCLHFFSIWGCGSLKSVSSIWMAAPQLEKLTLLGCPDIEFSAAAGDPHRYLRSLEIGYSDKLVSCATFMNSQFHRLTHLEIDGHRGSGSGSKSFPKEGWLPASLESLKLNGIKSVETLECKGLAHLTSLKELTIQFCPKLENMEGEMLPASLLRLTFTFSPLLGKRCEMKDPQVWPKISHINTFKFIHFDLEIQQLKQVRVNETFLQKANEEQGRATIMDTVDQVTIALENLIT